MAGDAIGVGLETGKKIQTLIAPQFDLHKIIRPPIVARSNIEQNLRG
jgi:hypothetical protein